MAHVAADALVSDDAARDDRPATLAELFSQAVATLVGGAPFVALLGPAPMRSDLGHVPDSIAGADTRVITAANTGPGTLTLKRVLSQVLDVDEPAELSPDEAARACERLLFPDNDEAITILRIDDAEALEPSALRSIVLIASQSAMIGQTLRVLFVGDTAFHGVWAAGAPAGLAERLAVIQPAVAPTLAEPPPEVPMPEVPAPDPPMPEVPAPEAPMPDVPAPEVPAPDPPMPDAPAVAVAAAPVPAAARRPAAPATPAARQPPV
ncbi:MAG: hypothetical protein J0H91_00550, partial [Rhodospirillales bacterium]|nr:hypothetical protein [Rhodospirillales bacterium]